MKVFVLIFLFLFASVFSFGKTEDSRLSGSSKNISLAKDSLTGFVKIAAGFSKTNRDSSLKYYLRSLNIARQINDYKCQSEILARILAIYQEFGELTEINQYEKELIKVYHFLLPKAGGKASVFIMLQLASSYMDVNTDSSLYYNNQAILLSDKYDDNISKAEALVNIGYIFSHLAENTKALEYFQNALTLFKKGNDKNGMAGTLQAISKINIFFGNYDNALANEKTAAQFYKEIKDNEGYYRALRHMGEIYYSKDNWKKSSEIFDTAVENAWKNKDFDIVSSIYQSLGSIYWRKKDYNEAIKYMMKALYLRTTYKEPAFRVVNTYSGLGNIYRSMKEHKKSLAYFLKAYELSKNLQNLNTLSKTEKNLGMTYAYLGYYQKSISFFNESIGNAQTIGNKSIILEDYYELQKVYDASKNYQDALNYFEKYSALKDSIDLSDNQNKISQYQSIYENEKRAKEIQLLKTGEQRVLFTSAVVISALVLVVLLFLLSRYKIKTISNKKLIEKNEEIAGILKKVKALNNNLKSSETTYRYLFERNPMPMLIWELSTFKILAVNAAAVNHYGYSNGEFLSMRISDLRPDPGTFEFERSYTELSSKIDKLENVKHKRKDGSLIDVEIIAHPLIFEGKNARHIMIQDVTERKLIEQAVIESEERYRNLFEGAPDAVILIDHHLEIIKEANPAAIRLLKKSWAELIGTSYLNLFPSSKIENLRQFFLVISERYSPSMIETEILQAGNVKVPVEISGTLVRSQSYSVYQVIIRDITFKKESERALLESQKRLIRTQKIAHVGNWELDLLTKDFWMSDEAYNIYGIEQTGDALFLETILNTVLEDDRKIIQNMIGELLKINLEFETVYKIKKQTTGEIRVIQTKAELIKNENGDRVKILGATRDITELTRYQDELIKAKDDAELSDRLKSDFLAQMSHEIRSPVNIILSFTSLIREEVNHNASEDMEMCFNAIDNGGRRLIRTIDLILNVADIQSGKLEVHLEKTYLAKDIIENLILEFSSAARSKGLKINFVNEAGEKALMLDRYTVTQIFANLIDNAIKYTKQGRIEIKLQEENNYIMVSVKDTGIGITEDYIPHLFDPFSQEEQGYARRFEGTGLGLSLVKKYCDVNNAGIEVESEKGEGTTFIVKFPM